MIATNRSFDELPVCSECFSNPSNPLSEMHVGRLCTSCECHSLLDAMLNSKDDDDVTELMPELSIWIERARLEVK